MKKMGCSICFDIFVLLSQESDSCTIFWWIVTHFKRSFQF